MNRSSLQNSIIIFFVLFITFISSSSALSAQITLAWDPNTEADLAGYKVYYGIASGTYGSPISVGNVTTYTLAGLTAGQTYYIALKAYNTSNMESDYSNEVSGVATTLADTTPPTTPTNLTATAVSSSQINLSWNASTDNVAVTGYRIYRGGTQIATSTTTSYSNTGLTPSTTYTYTVAAYDAAGNVSPQSPSVSATTRTGLSPPQNLKIIP